ncbi:uncharacterized protein B0P05DRAFT_179957 [Gilbertella persicaria]|uniref:uncharacterized protein n=1 Tax=Gilbertella persicaria TaxID=101096 RepID=UPI0022207393|nr:uncharacterized protein B0P05DRAFT_179957 [Gilbertella persicaria]KAI8071119.1 hypothetical protein B0P05DRAFT_179957 [Gilbertella persicaria]
MLLIFLPLFISLLSSFFHTIAFRILYSLIKNTLFLTYFCYTHKINFRSRTNTQGLSKSASQSLFEFKVIIIFPHCKQDIDRISDIGVL